MIDLVALRLEMEAVVLWARLVGLIEKYYPSGKRGRAPIGAERMLRVYFLQQWYGLANLVIAKRALRAP